MREECERSRRPLELLIEPAGREVVINALAPLVLVFGKSVEAESPVFWRVYTDALSDLPRMALDRAVGEWERTGKFFPKPAEIRELAEVHAQPIRQAAWRVRSVLEWSPPKVINEADRIPAEQMAEVLSAFHDRMSGMDMLARTKNRQMRPPQAKTDETGMSAEARALLDRQNPNRNPKAA